MIQLRDTPTEKYQGIYVKREDLSAPFGAPPFSKIRGLVKHLEKVKQEGYKGVAYVETSISMAGWGVAWASHLIGLKCLIFNPIYKTPLPLLQYHRVQWKRWGAELVNIPAGRAKVNYYIARKQIPKGYMLLPLGLPLPETVEETYNIAKSCVKDFPSIVISTGSGTITAGVWQATLPGQTTYGILCRSGSVKIKRKQIMGKSMHELSPFIPKGKLKLIDVGWEYTTASEVQTPFPCHPYYDAKAWEWVIKNKEELKHPVLFWNIGSTGEFDKEGNVGC